MKDKDKKLTPKQRAVKRLKRSRREAEGLLQQIRSVSEHLQLEIKDGSWTEVTSGEARSLHHWTRELVEVTRTIETIKWIYPDL